MSKYLIPGQPVILQVIMGQLRRNLSKICSLPVGFRTRITEWIFTENFFWIFPKICSPNIVLLSLCSFYIYIWSCWFCFYFASTYFFCFYFQIIFYVLFHLNCQKLLTVINWRVWSNYFCMIALSGLLLCLKGCIIYINIGVGFWLIIFSLTDENEVQNLGQIKFTSFNCGFTFHWKCRGSLLLDFFL